LILPVLAEPVFPEFIQLIDCGDLRQCLISDTLPDMFFRQVLAGSFNRIGKPAAAVRLISVLE
jgi:hypothetical protein